MMAPWASGSGAGPLGGYKLGGDGMAESESSLERVMKAVERELEESDPGYGDGCDGCDRFDSDTGGYVEKDYEKDEAGIEFSSSAMVERVPEAVAARLENMEDICFYGLLSPLGLAWVSVDDTLSLWLPSPAPSPRPPPRVIHCRDYISAVGLVRTDPGRSYPCESVGPYLLVVALRECVELYSLHQTGTELVVLETGMEVPVESMVSSMVCTDNGRVLVGCSDGCVYELHYSQAAAPALSLSSMWRPTKMRKTSCQGLRWGEIGRRVTSLWQPYVADPVVQMTYDPSRHVVFAVTQNKPGLGGQAGGSMQGHNTLIHAYQLGTSGDSAPRHIGPVKLSLIASSVSPANREIIAIHPILVSESSRMSCVLVSSTGYRFYVHLDDRSRMALRMVKPPPPLNSSGGLASSSRQVSSPQGVGMGRRSEDIARVQASVYCNGVFILCLPGWVVCCCQDRNKESYRSSGEAREVYSLFQVPNDSLGQPVHMWQVAEIETTMRWGDVSLLTRDQKMRTTHDLWTQHLAHPRRFIVLGSSGLLVLHRRQPWEKLDYACKNMGLVQAARAPQGQEGLCRHVLRFPREQACATSLLWWVLTQGDRPGVSSSNPSVAASVLLDMKPVNAQGGVMPLVAHAQVASMQPLDPRFRGILIALSRFLRPFWNEKVFAGSGKAMRHGEWKYVVSQLHFVNRFLTEFEDRLPGHQNGRQDDMTVREIRDFVAQCRELSSLLCILTKDPQWHTLAQSKDEDIVRSKDLDFRTLVLRIICKPHNDLTQQQLLSVILKLIQQTARTSAVYSPGAASDQGARAASKRETLVSDIETQCPNIFKPFERSKMRAESWLSEAKESRESNPERLEACLFKAKEHYLKLSMDLTYADLARMCDCFIELGQHMSALQVLLKRFSEQVDVAGNEADLYRAILGRLALVEDESVFEAGLNLSLSDKGLYRHALRGDYTEPAVYGVYRCVLEGPDSGYLWPILRRLPLLRKVGSAQHYLVEFLRIASLAEKLCDLYNETEQYSKAGEVCLQQANAHCVEAPDGKISPTLTDRIHWFRQAAKAAKLNGGALNNNTQASLLDQYADIAHIQQHLTQCLDEGMPVSVRHDALGLLHRLTRELLSLQEIFERACEFDCYDVAMEVCEAASSGGDVQSGYLNLSQVMSKLWKLILHKAWRGDGTSDEVPEDAWARVEASVCDIGRRFARKDGFLPVHELVIWLEECAHKNFYCTPEMQDTWNNACRAERRDHYFWCGDGGVASLSAPAFRVPRLLLLSLGIEPLKLIKAYCDMLDSAVMSADGRKRTHCFRTLVMLYTVFLRDARDTDQEALLPFAAIENDFVRLEAKPGVFAGELQQARGLLSALRVRREGIF